MQLVLVTDNIPAKNEFVDSLRLYKYRNEVKLLEGLNEKEVVSLTAAAWCAVNLSPLYSDIYFLQNAYRDRQILLPEFHGQYSCTLQAWSAATEG